ncbi:GFA family protein [Kangiella marina]|uniref:GFA family protein n=1 Tax=Kangiella marina TaxID=1079178 RepID=A0ABP8IMR9_9GAMM
MSNKGSCLCGEVKFEVEGNFEKLFFCHCTRCQKNTGSAHCANLFSGSASINWISGKEQVKTYHLPETRHAKSFCVNCGSAMPTEVAGGKMIVVPAGCLDDDVTIQANGHIFMDDKASWESLLEETPKFSKLPG